jgi:hypothetical protein
MNASHHFNQSFWPLSLRGFNHNIYNQLISKAMENWAKYKIKENLGIF